MEGMREHYGTITGRVNEDTIVHGATEGEVVVPSGVRLVVQGATAGLLVIEEGGSAEVNGTVVGPVRNSGRLRVSGLVLGDVRDVGAGKTDVNVNVNIGDIRFHVVEPHPRAEGAPRVNESVSDTTIDHDVVVNGSVGDVVIADGVFAQINGSVSGELLVSAGAEVRLHGSVGRNARIRNRGRLDVYGTLSGSIVDEYGGTSEIHEGEILHRDA
jgi:hypothetical protein